MQNNGYKVGHHHTPNGAWIQRRSQPQQQQQQAYRTSSSDQSVVKQSCFHCQRPSDRKIQCLQPQQQTRLFSDIKNEQQCPLDDLDSSIEEDIENLLKELEREEKKQHDLFKQLLVEQLKHDDSVQSTPQHQRSYVEETEYTETLKEMQSNEEQIQYNNILLKELEECELLIEVQLDSLKEFEKNKQRPLKKVNVSCLSDKRMKIILHHNILF